MSGLLSHPVCATCHWRKEVSGDDHRGVAYLYQVCGNLDIQLHEVNSFYCADYLPESDSVRGYDPKEFARVLHEEHKKGGLR